MSVARRGLLRLAPFIVNGAKASPWDRQTIVILAIYGFINFGNAKQTRFTLREVLLHRIHVGESAQAVRGALAVFAEGLLIQVVGASEIGLRIDEIFLGEREHRKILQGSRDHR